MREEFAPGESNASQFMLPFLFSYLLSSLTREEILALPIVMTLPFLLQSSPQSQHPFETAHLIPCLLKSFFFLSFILYYYYIMSDVLLGVPGCKRLRGSVTLRQVYVT